MRTDNPSRVMLMIGLAALLTALFSCDKPTIQESAPEVPPNYYLSLNGLGMNIRAFKNTGLMLAVHEGKQSGYLVTWDADTLTLNLFIYGDTLPTYGSGTIRGNSFLMNCDSSSLNICNGQQNTQIHYEVKRDTTTLH